MLLGWMIGGPNPIAECPLRMYCGKRKVGEEVVSEQYFENKKIFKIVI